MEPVTLTIYNANLAYARRLTADLTDDQATAQPVAGMNHAAWVIGHLAFTTDMLTKLVGIDEPTIDPAYLPALNNQSKPVADRSAYPPLADLLAALERGHARLLEGLQAIDPAALDATTPYERARDRFPKVGDFLTYLMTAHEATHLGQLSAWRRAHGLPSV